MGNPAWDHKFAIWRGVTPEGRVFKARVRAWFQTRFWSRKRLAEVAFEDIDKQFPRPSAVPDVTILLKGYKFRRTRQGVVYEIKEEL